MKPEGGGGREGGEPKEWGWGAGQGRGEQAQKEWKGLVLNFLASRALVPQLCLLLCLLYCFPEALHWILAYFSLLQLLGRGGSSCLTAGF